MTVADQLSERRNNRPASEASMSTKRRSFKHAKHTLFPLIIAAIGMASCATRPHRSGDSEHLVIENASENVIRVLLDLGNGTEWRIGRLDPMTRAALPIPPGLLAYPNARIRVVRFGTPRLVLAADSPGDTAPRSDAYAVADLIRFVWRYSENTIQMLGNPDRKTDGSMGKR
jgi:hypothetical protein